jgi:hypothetical protein
MLNPVYVVAKDSDLQISVFFKREGAAHFIKAGQ